MAKRRLAAEDRASSVEAEAAPDPPEAIRGSMSCLPPRSRPRRARRASRASLEGASRLARVMVKLMVRAKSRTAHETGKKPVLYSIKL